MGFRTIPVKEDVYEKIRRHKKEGESFTELFDRTFDNGDVMQYAGAWSDMSEDDIQKIQEDIKQFREDFDSDAATRRERIFT